MIRDDKSSRVSNHQIPKDFLVGSSMDSIANSDPIDIPSIINIADLKVAKKEVPEIESWMSFVPKIVTDESSTGRIIKIGIGMDLGSTYTRSRIYNTEDETISESRSVNTTTILVKDTSTVNSTSKELYANLEFKITDTSDNKSKPFDFIPEPVHFVRGELAITVPGTGLDRPSNMSKIKLLGTYLDVLINIALNSIESVENEGACYGIIIIPELCVALPPSDFKSTKMLEEFKENLSGTYKVEMPRIGYEVEIKILPENIFIDKEPNAVQFSVALMDEAILNKTSMVVDGGGKSTDYSFMLEGRIMDKVAETGEFGGNSLITKIIDSYVSRTGNRAPKPNQVEDALVDGVLRRGNSTYDIYTDIVDAKKDMAQGILNRMLKVLDKAESSLDDLQQLTLHGRLFTDTVIKVPIENSEEHTYITISVASELEKLIKSSVSTGIKIEIVVILETGCICEGVIYSKWVG